MEFNIKIIQIIFIIVVILFYKNDTDYRIRLYFTILYNT